MRMMLLLPFALAAVAGPASAQTTGLCSAIADRAARMECLGRPAGVAPTPQASAAASLPGCTTAAPCSDSRGAYYTTRSGGKRYITRR